MKAGDIVETPTKSTSTNDLSGRTTVVVGASRGLGRGIARAFAEAGAPVVAVARTGPALAELAGASPNIATEIADAGANIEYVSMERPDGDRVVNMFFSVQVRDRRHLAHVMRALRRLSEVKRVHRART